MTLSDLGAEGTHGDDANKPKKQQLILTCLQKIFVQLKELEKPYASTEELTKAFGWSLSQVYFEQHDVQELTRVLFDVLGKAFKKTSQKDLIETLYRGKLASQVLCQKCQNRSERVEDFYDLTLMVKDMNSITDSFRKLFEVEELKGDNQYLCKVCKMKVDAKKGVVLRQVPPLLILSLQRFDYDWTKDQRFKITSRQEFPEVLAMRPYLEDNEENKMLSEDETTYELFSVVIHVGNAYKGHFHAYIRDLLREGKLKEGQYVGNNTTSGGDPVSIQWYDFNDKYVYPLLPSSIEKQYGGLNSEVTETAYMLLYRRKDMSHYENLYDGISLGIPSHLKEEMRLLNEKAAKEKKELEYEESVYKMNIYIPDFFCCSGEFLHPTNYDFSNGGGDTYKYIAAAKSMLVKDFRKSLHSHFEGKLPEEFDLYYLDRSSYIMSSDRYRITGKNEGEDEKSLLKTRYIQNRIHLLAATERTLAKIPMAKGGEVKIRYYHFISPEEPSYEITQVAPNLSIAEFRKVMSKLTHIPLTRLLTFRYNERSKPVELTKLHSEKAPLFILSDVLDSASLSVEDLDKTAICNPDGSKKPGIPFVLQRFNAEQKKITLFIIDRVTDQMPQHQHSSNEYNLKSSLDWTVKKLKEKILQDIKSYWKMNQNFDPVRYVLRMGGQMSPGQRIEEENKTLEEAHIENYDRIYIEEKVAASEIELLFTEITMNSHLGESWKMSLSTQLTLRQVKDLILKERQQMFPSCHEFRFREDSRWGNTVGSILSNEESTLENLNLRKGDKLFLEYGSPLKEMITLKLFHLDWPPMEKSQLPGNGHVATAFRYVRVSEFLTLTRFKEVMLLIVDEFKGKVPSTSHLRIRDLIKEDGVYGMNRPIHAYTSEESGKSLKDLGWKEDKDLGIQVLSQPDDFVHCPDPKSDSVEGELKKKFNHCYLLFRRRLVGEKKFSMAFEVCCDGTSLKDLSALREEIHKFFEDIPLEKMLLAKYNFRDRTWTLINDDLAKNNDATETSTKNVTKKSLKEKYNLTDGDVVIVLNVDDDPLKEDAFYTKPPMEEIKEVVGAGGNIMYVSNMRKETDSQLKIQFDE